MALQRLPAVTFLQTGQFHVVCPTNKQRSTLEFRQPIKEEPAPALNAQSGTRYSTILE